MLQYPYKSTNVMYLFAYEIIDRNIAPQTIAKIANKQHHVVILLTGNSPTIEIISALVDNFEAL